MVIVLKSIFDYVSDSSHIPQPKSTSDSGVLPESNSSITSSMWSKPRQESRKDNSISSPPNASKSLPNNSSTCANSSSKAKAFRQRNLSPTEKVTYYFERKSSTESITPDAEKITQHNHLKSAEAKAKGEALPDDEPRLVVDLTGKPPYTRLP